MEGLQFRVKRSRKLGDVTDNHCNHTPKYDILSKRISLSQFSANINHSQAYESIHSKTQPFHENHLKQLQPHCLQIYFSKTNQQSQPFHFLYQFYKIQSMSQLSEQNQQLLEERLQTQSQTNQQIFSLIDEAIADSKKYLPYGPTLMRVYNDQRIQVNNSALLKTIDDEKKNFCNKQCKGQDNCFNKCENFYTWATNYGLSYFHNVHKYAYTPTVPREEE